MPTYRKVTAEERARAVNRDLARRGGSRFRLTPGQARAITEGARPPARKEPAMTTYAKAVWAFLSALVGALTTAVMAAPSHTFSGVQTLGWLGVATTVLLVTGGVYGLTNGWTPPSGPPSPPQPPPPTVEQPGYQPDPQKGDDAARAQRIARAQEVLQNGAMTGRADAGVFHSDMHQVARQAADLGNLRPAWVPSPGNPPIG